MRKNVVLSAAIALSFLAFGCAVEGLDSEPFDEDLYGEADFMVEDESSEDSAAVTKEAPVSKAVTVASSQPVALGSVLSNGTKYAGSSNFTSVYNASLKRYEITISGEYYYYLNYATNITPAGDIRFCRTGSISGKMTVYCHDANGNPAQSRFQFVTFKL